MTSRRNNMKKIAIMGARGFVGKALTAHLQDKYGPSFESWYLRR